jgi:hypothetical protein
MYLQAYFNYIKDFQNQKYKFEIFRVRVIKPLTLDLCVVTHTALRDSMGKFYTCKLGYKCGSHVLQYHLDCIALEQAPMKWICEACEV